MRGLANEVASVFEGDVRAVAFPTNEDIAGARRTSQKDNFVETSR